MTSGPTVGRLDRAESDGFTLVELLVAMIVVGLLAAIAVPAFTAQRRRAYEASAKSDVKAVVKEALAYYVDGSGPLTLSGTEGVWSMTAAGAVVAGGSLSAFNSISSASYVNSDNDYCISVRNSKAGAQFWTGDRVGLRAGDC
ncbi:MAG: secretory protein [Frankiales bacterium]|nr:secretory protein [Frankiales bacterium]